MVTPAAPSTPVNRTIAPCTGPDPACGVTRAANGPVLTTGSRTRTDRFAAIFTVIAFPSGTPLTSGWTDTVAAAPGAVSRRLVSKPFALRTPGRTAGEVSAGTPAVNATSSTDPAVLTQRT